MTKLSIKIGSLFLIGLILLSLIDRFSFSSGRIQLMGIWMVKNLNLSTHIVFPLLIVHKHSRIRLDSLIHEHIQNDDTLYAAKIAELLAESNKQSVPFKAALGLANAVQESPDVAKQLAIIAREHPNLKVRCYWQAQLNQGTIITMVNSPGPNQAVSQYLVLPETHCPAKQLDLPAHQ